MTDQCNKLSPLGLGLALGIMWALSILITGLAGMHFDWGEEFIDVMGSVYVGFEASVKGSLVGAGWALLDGFIGGFILAWLYNCLCKCCGKKCN